MLSKSAGLEVCPYHRDQYYTKACQQCQLPVCVQCMDLLEHKGHSFFTVYDLLSEKKAELYKSLKRCRFTKSKLLDRKKQLKTEVDKRQFMMKSKYRTLQCLLDEYLLQNLKKLEAFLKSQTDDIDSKVDDINRYISGVNNKMEEASKILPAQALIQLQSCSTREDLFKTHRIKFPDIGMKETDLIKAVNLFGNQKLNVHFDLSGRNIWDEAF